eukprot:jgi/Hompol1/1107/HPOL_003168-RA
MPVYRKSKLAEVHSSHSSARSASVRQHTIDLTKEDSKSSAIVITDDTSDQRRKSWKRRDSGDDDVKITGVKPAPTDAIPAVICFGMIGATLDSNTLNHIEIRKAMADKNLLPVNLALLAVPNQSYMSIEVKTKTGILNMKDAILLKANIYGNSRVAKVVGQVLLKNRIYLLAPENPTRPYINPQSSASFKKTKLPDQSEGSFGHPQDDAAAERRAQESIAERNAERMQSQIEAMYNSLTSAEDLPELEPAETLITPLYKHQRQALYFMTQREVVPDFSASSSNANSREANTSATLFWILSEGIYRNTITDDHSKTMPKLGRGGILADDMGLGKTIEVISLILKSLPANPVHPPSSMSSTVTRPSSPQSELYSSNTQQRLQEPSSAFPSQSQRVSDPQRILVPPSRSTTAKSSEDEIAMYNQDRSLIPSRATLIVCPLSTVTNWEDQIESHTLGQSLSVYVYHGTSRSQDSAFIASHDVVITTYQTLATSFIKDIKDIRKRGKASNGTPSNATDTSTLSDSISTSSIASPLHEIYWFRVVLTLMKAITLRRTKHQLLDGKPILELPPKHERIVMLELDDRERLLYTRIHDKAKRLFSQLEADGAVMRNYMHILEAILRMRQASVHPRLCSEVKELLNSDEFKSHLNQNQNSVSTVSTSLAADPLPLAVTATTALDQPFQEIIDLDVFEVSKQSPKILPVNDAGQKPVDSMQLSSDIVDLMNSDEKSNADVGNSNDRGLNATKLDDDALNAFSDDDLDLVAIDDSANAEQRDHDWLVFPTKVNALLEHLIESRATDTPGQLPVKSIVFSQWTQVLSLLERPLREHGFKFVRIDGKMSRKSRHESLTSFRIDPSTTVLLASLKTGGVGLNLTSASQVFIMEPYWNPSIERQAIDRVHRMGQTRQVHSIRFITKNTIEENILAMQQKKLELSQMTFKETGDDRVDVVEDVAMDDDNADGGQDTTVKSRKRNASGGATAAGGGGGAERNIKKRK